MKYTSAQANKLLKKLNDEYSALLDKERRYTFAKSKDERSEDAYRFIGMFEWSETTPSGEHIYKRLASDMKLKWNHAQCPCTDK